MIKFKDFAPEATSTGWFSESWPTLDVLVAAMNTWLQETGVEVMNIETVVVPALASGTSSTVIVPCSACGSVPAGLVSRGGVGTTTLCHPQITQITQMG